MRNFLTWSFGIVLSYYLFLFASLDRSRNLALNDLAHLLVLYGVPIGLLTCTAVKTGLFRVERRTMAHVAALLFASFVVLFVALQLAGVLFCIIIKECF
jgi:hypothetical protein